MSLLLKALQRLETRGEEAHVTSSGDEPLAANEELSQSVELLFPDAPSPITADDLLTLDPALWNAELPATLNVPKSEVAEIDESPATLSFVAASEQKIESRETDQQAAVADLANALPEPIDGNRENSSERPRLSIFIGDDDVADAENEDAKGNSPQTAVAEVQPASIPDIEPIQVLDDAIPPVQLVQSSIVDEEQELHLDRAALGARISELRMQGLCENIASHIDAAREPVVLLVPVLPFADLKPLAESIARQFANRLQEAPRLIDLGGRYRGTSVNPIQHLAEIRRSAKLVILMADSAESLSVSAWLPACDAIYLIVDRAATPRRAVYEAIAGLRRQNSRLAGCILLDAA